MKFIKQMKFKMDKKFAMGFFIFYFFSLAIVYFISGADNNFARAQATPPPFDKVVGDQLTANEWNRLVYKFIDADRSDTMTGSLVVTGSLGLGITPPDPDNIAQKLQVEGNAAISLKASIGGAGITSTSDALTVQGIDGTIRIINSSNGTYWKIGMYGGYDQNLILEPSSNIGAFAVRKSNGGTNVFMVNTAGDGQSIFYGNVGINTNTIGPTQPLDVNGAAKVQQIILTPQSAPPANLTEGMMWVQ